MGSLGRVGKACGSLDSYDLLFGALKTDFAANETVDDLCVAGSLLTLQAVQCISTTQPHLFLDLFLESLCLFCVSLSRVCVILLFATLCDIFSCSVVIPLLFFAVLFNHPQNRLD